MGGIYPSLYAKGICKGQGIGYSADCCPPRLTPIPLRSPRGPLQTQQNRSQGPDGGNLFCFRSLHSNKFGSAPKTKKASIYIEALRLILPFAEREGFEPPEHRCSTVFKTAAFDHSAIFPCWWHKGNAFFHFYKKIVNLWS